MLVRVGRQIKKQCGYALLLFAMMLPVSVAILCFAVDFGYRFLVIHQLNINVGSAALAAAGDQSQGESSSVLGESIDEIINRNPISGANDFPTATFVEGCWNGSSFTGPAASCDPGESRAVRVEMTFQGNYIIPLPILSEPDPVTDFTQEVFAVAVSEPEIRLVMTSVR